LRHPDRLRVEEGMRRLRQPRDVVLAHPAVDHAPLWLDALDAAEARDQAENRGVHQPQIACATWRRKRTPSSRSSTGTRSFAEWISRAAVSGSIARAGKNPYATVPNASRIQCESVKPATQTGAATAAGSSAATNDCTASHSGPLTGE